MPSNLTAITNKQTFHCLKRFVLLAIMAGIILPASTLNNRAYSQSSPGKKFTVTIDAGHGGRDPGAVGKKSMEKNIALAIALKLGHYIESLMNDVDVFYTRKTDVFIELIERGQIANRNHSDLFISIHVNANKKSAPYGTSTYVMGFSKSAENLDLVRQENNAIFLEPDYQTKYAGFDPNSPQSYIEFNNLQNNNLAQSLEIATAVQDQLRTNGQRKDTGVHQGNLIVLWGCAKPSILIETGFISNPKEEEFLMTDAGQDIIASSIFTAFRQYKESIDAKVSSLSKTAGSGHEPEKKALAKNSSIDSGKATEENVVKPTENDRKKPDSALNGGGTPKSPGDNGKNPAESETITSAGPDTEVEYRIQVLASAKKLSPGAKDFKGLKGLKEFSADGYYKYMTEPVKSYQKALEMKRKLVASFRGAFIVAFRNGERIPLTTVNELRVN